MKLKIIKYLSIFLLGIFIGFYISSLWTSDKTSEVAISHYVVVDKIESLGTLEVVRYNIQDIVEYKKMRQWLPNAKTALLISGEIIACVDMTKISEERVTITGDSIQLVLPSPEICHVKVDHSKSKIYDTTYGLWESAQLMDEAYKHAEIELERQANRMNYSERAKDNAIIILTPILQTLGFNHVLIRFDDSLVLPQR